ncbi:hypothetical protein AK830_g5428 [Neonectria ditissima]|uniref:Transcription factor domain-containing protein n=1 Tax=Neonectria ditissima TaxID=78410 RepID=A0A0P7BEE6_9HYPO|nr:hypothetical protein AK830_g5428 [Neonectria ditissima]
MPNPTTQFAFISLDGSGRPKTEGRSLIRSHCMQGKNRQENSRRSIRRARKAEKQGLAAQASPDSLSLSSSPNLMPLVPIQRHTQHPFQTMSHKDKIETGKTSSCEAVVASPMLPVVLPYKAPMGSNDLIHNILHYDMLLKKVYTLDQSLDFQSVEMSSQALQWLLLDDAFCQSIFLTTSAFNDFMAHRPPSKTTRFNLRRTVALLNSALSDKKAYLIDTTIYTILGLTLLAGMFGEYSVLGTHMAGLRQIVRMRGDIETLRLNPKMHFKIDRVDLMASLCTGARPLFSTDSISWNSVYCRPLTLEVSDGAIPLLRVVQSLDDWRLVNIFQDLQNLTRLINEHVGSNVLFSGNAFQTAVSSIQTRLLGLQESLNDTVAEALRLGMLAFLSTTFQVPGHKVPYKYLSNQLRISCHAIEPSTPELRDILFWLLMMGLISALDVDEVWVRSKWALACGLTSSWAQARERLQTVMWLDCIHEQEGRRLFAKLNCVCLRPRADRDPEVSVSVVGTGSRDLGDNDRYV